MLSIDITDTHVRLVKGRASGKKLSVYKADSRELLNGSIQNGFIKDLFLVASEITDILVSNKIKEKETIACINSGTILYKELLLPKPRVVGKASESLMESMIRNDMSLPEEYNISYTVVGEEIENGAVMCKLVATACPQKMINGYIALFKQVGLNLKQIALSNNSISRLIRNSSVYKNSMPLLLLQADSRFVNINLYREGRISLSRYMRAEPADYEHNPDYVNLVVFDNLFRIVHFLNQQTDEEPVKEIQFYGIIKDTNSLKNSISQFNIPARELEMPKELDIKCQFDFLHYAGAIGSFYKVNKKTENINLLDSTQSRKIHSQKVFFIASVIVAAVCMSIVGALTYYTDLVKNMAVKEYDTVCLEYEQLNYEEINRISKEKQADIGVFENYIDKVQLAKDLFDFQPKMIPDIIEKLKEPLLDGMSVGTGVSVSGYSVSATIYCPYPEQPSLYTEALMAQGYFVDISFNGYSAINSDNQDGAAAIAGMNYTFSLTMRIKGGNQFEVK